MGDATPTPGRVWEAYHSTDPVTHEFVGYLVTDRDDPHRPLALVLTSFCGKPGDARLNQLALRTARRLAVAPFKIATTFAARDLRMFCRLDTPMPFPAEMYGWRLGPVGGGGFDVFPFAPFCRFRFAKQVAAWCRLAFTPGEVRDHPDAYVTLRRPREDPRDEGGPFIDSPVVIPAADYPL